MQISVSIKRGQDILLTTFKILNKKDTPGYSSNLLMNTRRNKIYSFSRVCYSEYIYS